MTAVATTDPTPTKTYLGPDSKVTVTFRGNNGSSTLEYTVLAIISKYQKESSPITTLQKKTIDEFAIALTHSVRTAMGGGSWVCYVSTGEWVDSSLCYMVGQVIRLTAGEFDIYVMGDVFRTQLCRLDMSFDRSPPGKRKKKLC